MAPSRRSRPMLGAVFVLVFALLPEAASTQVAIIVNRANPVANLNLEQVRRLYLGMSTTFPGGTRVILIESPMVRAPFYRELVDMTHDEFKRHWVGVVFGGEDATPPKEIAVAQELLQFVGGHAGAIAFIPLGDVDTSVKVVAIDGVKPGDAAYPLRAATGDAPHGHKH